MPFQSSDICIGHAAEHSGRVSQIIISYLGTVTLKNLVEFQHMVEKYCGQCDTFEVIQCYKMRLI